MREWNSTLRDVTLHIDYHNSGKCDSSTLIFSLRKRLVTAKPKSKAKPDLRWQDRSERALHLQVVLKVESAVRAVANWGAYAVGNDPVT